MKGELPFTQMRIKYNPDVPNEERLRVYKRFTDHTQAISGVFDFAQNTSLVKFSCPSVVAELMCYNDHQSIRLEVNRKNNSRDDPLTLYADCLINDGRIEDMRREIADLEGRVVSNLDGETRLLCEFKNLFKSSRALVRLQRNYKVKFANTRKCDIWKITQINDFGNPKYKPPEPKTRAPTPKPKNKEPKNIDPRLKHLDVVPEPPPKYVNLTPTSRRTFYIRTPKNTNTEVLIETVFKSLQGFELCKKFKFNCDKDNVFYKMKFSSADTIAKAVDVLNTLCFQKEVKMGEDFYRPVMAGPPVKHVLPEKAVDEIYEKFDVKGMLEEILYSGPSSKKIKLEADVKFEL